ncbi:MAG: M23 family metallopeptidase [Lachnospiraceae bacterium]|jgi:murein DD-endopeptidase MepM/ murein hydrolase activator NlpD|nr:M23 family metallopeptidase [Lachnospiraceae bacterium]
MPRREKNKGLTGFRNLVIGSTVTLVVAIIGFIVTYNIYTKKLNENLNYSLLDSQSLADLVSEADIRNQVESVTSEMGKTVEEVKSGLTETESSPLPSTEINTDASLVNTAPSSPEPTPEPMPEFKKSVDGEILREYAKDSLIYSETLKEWITHNGVDIKTNKGAVVKASADGVVEAIKNDPRYGLTVIVSHTRGFKTVYSNLLTAEFVSIGEMVVSGQTLGTVGNTASFEIADEYHLHFEVLENGEYVDPTIYIK